MKYLAGLVIALAGCGRIAFDPRSDGRATGDTAMADAAPHAVVQLRAGGQSTCVLLGSGDVWCCGDAELDGGSPDPAVPARIAAGRPVRDLDVNDHGACGLAAGGIAMCWGNNGTGQLGLGTTTPVVDPVDLAVTDIAETAMGTNAGCIRHSSGQVACAGDALILGDGSTTQRATFGDVPGVSDAIQISAGDDHVCALRSNGSVTCWGLNSYGQLGNGTMTGGATPVAGPVGPYSAISVGDSHTCALRGGIVDCWGRNLGGRLGDGTENDRPVAAAVPGITDAIQVDAGGAHTCILHATGTVSCWGSNLYGEVGPDASTPQLSPIPVSNLGDVVELSARTSIHTCVRMRDNSIWCWGSNGVGQLGRGTVGGTFAVPAPVQGLPAL